jgi:hypothetical protein
MYLSPPLRVQGQLHTHFTYVFSIFKQDTAKLNSVLRKGNEAPELKLPGKRWAWCYSYRDLWVNTVWLHNVLFRDFTHTLILKNMQLLPSVVPIHELLEGKTKN